MVVEGVLLVSRRRMVCLEQTAKVDVLLSEKENRSVTKAVTELRAGDIVVGLGRLDIVAPVLIGSTVESAAMLAAASEP
jgi:hypothetical protein